MVAALGPGKFYGSALPRPRFYSDVKLSPDGLRVDPPPPVLDPLLSWARDAHWSMGGLSFLRRRLQGRIEGSVKRLRAHHDRLLRGKKRTGQRLRDLPEEEPEIADSALSSSSDDDEEDTAAPVPAVPRRSGRTRRLVVHEDEDEDEEEERVPPTPPVEEEEQQQQRRKKRARKLGDEFDRVAGAASPAKVDSAPAAPAAAAKEARKGKVVAVTRRSGRISPTKK